MKRYFFMKTIAAFLLMLAISIPVLAQPISIIPQPSYLQSDKGSFTLPDELVILLPAKNAAIESITNMLVKQLKNSLNRNAKIVTYGSKYDMVISLLDQPMTKLGKEGYMLTISGKEISLKANDAPGIFYGLQTLLQLMPAEIESKQPMPLKTIQIPAVTIVDFPRFGWRGLMLDVARHWFDKAQVKTFIDNMVKYKYNMLHLHLSDDQGWRLEIKSLPKLTEVGAWRAPRQGRWGEWSKPTPDEPKTYGGFFTQEDIKELLAYAKERYVTIMPEIDIPGHSMAILAAYPELSCTPGTYQVNAGDRFMIWPAGGKFYGTIDNNLCPANEKVYEILDKIFTEIAALFPFEYIHMGGDECYKGFWEKSDAISKLMQEKGLKDQHEVQSYFVKRVADIIHSKGKKMMGWDEIMEGGLAPGAAVMSWQGEKGGIAAANMKHPVVMSPNTFTYVDLYQGDPVAEPPTYSMVRLSKSYQFNPLPAGIDSQYVLGGQANLWSERLNTQRHAEYMLWPRGLAVAESVWSPMAVKNWPDFVRRTETHFNRMDVAGTKYARSMYDPIFSISKGSDGEPLIALTTEIEDLAIHYSFDESFPDAFYPIYTQPLTLPKEAVNLKVITSRDGKLVGKIINMPVTEIRKRMK